jgi:hypothetical protein
MAIYIAADIGLETQQNEILLSNCKLKAFVNCTLDETDGDSFWARLRYKKGTMENIRFVVLGPICFVVTGKKPSSKNSSDPLLAIYDSQYLSQIL